MPFVGGVSVHDPGHGLLVGAHVGRGNIGFWADEGEKFVGETSGEGFELAGVHRSGVAGDATFCAAEREIHERALPTHPHGECGDFAEFDVWRVADTAFAGAEGEVVLDAMSGEGVNLAIVHPDG